MWKGEDSLVVGEVHLATTYMLSFAAWMVMDKRRNFFCPMDLLVDLCSQSP